MRRLVLWTVAWTLAIAAVFAAVAGGVVVMGGVYDVAATAQHTPWVYDVLQTAFERSVRRRARDIQVPQLDAAATLQRGAVCYRAHCVACHGAPGVAPGPAALAMQPLPGPLVDAALNWRTREVYWITRHGVRMSGMPAWEHRMRDVDLWAVTAFVVEMRTLSPAAWTQRERETEGIPCAAKL